MRSRFTVLLVTALALLASAPEVVHAGGFELPGAGTRALGRGGAFHARADDPMALLFNPANLSAMPGYQVYLTGGIAWFDACHQRTSTPTNTYADAPVSGTGDTYFTPTYSDAAWPRQCNTGGPGPLLSLGATFELMPGLGVGVGVVAPNGVGHGSWAEDTDYYTSNRTDGGMPLEVPPAERYVLLTQNQLFLYPTVGVGYSPVSWLRFGASFQWGLGVLNFTNMVVPAPGEHPATDVRARLDAHDYFVPGVIASVHFVPHDNLDVMLGFRWSDAVRAEMETLLTYGWYGLGTEDGSVAGPVPTVTRLPNGELTVGQPYSFQLGIRYAQRITPRPRDPSQVERLSGRIEDSMSNEWFDIELDLVYERNSQIGDIHARMPESPMLAVRTSPGGGGAVSTSSIPLPRDIYLPHQWNDQWSLRLGGDWNPIPGLLSLRLGASIETSAYDSSLVFSDNDAKRYVNLDFIPAFRVGIHGGLTVRLGRLDVSLAYAHVFQETVEIGAPSAACNMDQANCTPDMAQLRQVSALNPETASIANAGIYEVDYDLLTLGVNWHL
jgi:long-chain fatty acid transport protein